MSVKAGNLGRSGPRRSRVLLVAPWCSRQIIEMIDPFRGQSVMIAESRLRIKQPETADFTGERALPAAASKSDGGGRLAGRHAPELGAVAGAATAAARAVATGFRSRAAAG